MPFVDEEHRAKPDVHIPGDRCFLEYQFIRRQWAESPRWTTVDTLAECIWPNKWKRAFALAFLVFFCLWVMPYEMKKREENGDI